MHLDYEYYLICGTGSVLAWDLLEKEFAQVVNDQTTQMAGGTPRKSSLQRMILTDATDDLTPPLGQYLYRLGGWRRVVDFDDHVGIQN